MHNILEIDSLIKSYGSKRILSNVYLKCETGEVVGILGRNGCGKSTLLKILFGTLSAENKSIRINKKVYSRLFRSKDQVAYLPQHSFLPEHVSLKSIVNAYIKDTESRRVILGDERIKKHLRKKTAQLSGGELRYFEMLLLVNLKTKFILLDEPFSGIEPIYIEKIKELIRSYCDKKGFIITDHDYQNILDVSDRIALIKDGFLKPIDKMEQLEEHNYLPAGTLSRNKKGGSKRADVPVKFEVDEQTLQDLDLFENSKEGLVVSIFDNVKTTGGKIRLHKMLKTPMSNLEILKDRSDSIRFFAEKNVYLKIEKKDIDFVEYYKTSKITFTKKNAISSVYQSLRYQFKPDNDYFTKKTGVEKTLGLLKYLSAFVRQFQYNDLPWYLSNIFFSIQEILMSKGVRDAISFYDETDLKALDLDELDRLFRKNSVDKINQILEMLYELEVFESVANSKKKHQLCFPEYSGSTKPNVKIEGLYHPVIENPVVNDFHIAENNSLCFLTGANMSGKSTFLKSFGLAVYLAHVGFPVPATKMETSIFNGLITTINLTDNISRGYSHFYSEVKRVKEAASVLKEKKKVVVIFDELFRGTNVKDASDASLMITSALSKIKKSIFLISTHIVEIAEDLKTKPNVFFNCFESKMEGETPRYSYKLKEGINKERFGMQIVKNENIVELLEEALEQ